MSLAKQIQILRKRIDRFVLPKGERPQSIGEITAAIGRRIGRVAGLRASEATSRYIREVEIELKRTDLQPHVRDELTQKLPTLYRVMQNRLANEKERPDDRNCTTETRNDE